MSVHPDYDEHIMPWAQLTCFQMLYYSFLKGPHYASMPLARAAHYFINLILDLNEYHNVIYAKALNDAIVARINIAPACGPYLCKGIFFFYEISY